MPKTIYTPRHELICGKIESLTQSIRENAGDDDDVSADWVNQLFDIQDDAQRMEAKLASRKDEVNALKKIIDQYKIEIEMLRFYGNKECTSMADERIQQELAKLIFEKKEA